MPNHGKCYEHLKRVSALQEDAECIYGSCRLPQITIGIFSAFISVAIGTINRHSDWGLNTSRMHIVKYYPHLNIEISIILVLKDIKMYEHYPKKLL